MLPRQVLPRQFYLITRRCSRRQFLLRPDPATNNAFLYCLINAALRCHIDLLLPCVMSNHYHAVVYDRTGRYPEFIEHLHKLVARSQNALRGRWENLWASEQTCGEAGRRDAVIDKLVYTATNPVADHLVERAHHWPGLNGLAALLSGRVLHATRPLHFFRENGAMPDELELALTIPPELGPADAVLAELRAQVHAVELERASERQRTGRRVLGRRAVQAQSWRDHPASREPRRNLRPAVASRSKWARLEALLRNRGFAMEYASARERWRDGAAAGVSGGHVLASALRLRTRSRDVTRQRRTGTSACAGGELARKDRLLAHMCQRDRHSLVEDERRVRAVHRWYADAHERPAHRNNDTS
jgi:putative transposase